MFTVRSYVVSAGAPYGATVTEGPVMASGANTL